MLDELDFTKEAANQEIFREFLRENNLDGGVTAPRVFTEASTKRVLTMVSHAPVDETNRHVKSMGFDLCRVYILTVRASHSRSDRIYVCGMWIALCLTLVGVLGEQMVSLRETLEGSPSCGSLSLWQPRSPSCSLLCSTSPKA